MNGSLVSWSTYIILHHVLLLRQIPKCSNNKATKEPILYKYEYMNELTTKDTTHFLVHYAFSTMWKWDTNEAQQKNSTNAVSKIIQFPSRIQSGYEKSIDAIIFDFIFPQPSEPV